MVELELIDQEFERVALGIGIPPCPAILLELSKEIEKDEPDFANVEKLVSKDVGLSATLMKTINSPFYGLRNKISSISQAITMLGLSMLSSIISGVVLRNIFSGQHPVNMERYWDTSAKIASAAMFIAKGISGINKEDAYTFGLFQNCGIPILIQKYPDYKQTLGKANNSVEERFTDIEIAAHGADHATIGYLMTNSWNMPDVITHAVRFHHEYSMLSDAESKISMESKDLIALGLLADRAVHLISGVELNFSFEWSKGGDAALEQLDISEVEFRDICEDVANMVI